MGKILLVLTCLACVGLGRRVQLVNQRGHSTALAESEKPPERVESPDADLRPQSLAEQTQSNRDVSIKGTSNRLRALIMLLSALDPAAQFAKEQAKGPPAWVSKVAKVLNMEYINAVTNVANQVKGLRRLPIVTIGFLAFNVLVQILQGCGVISTSDYALSPYQVWKKHMLSLQLVLSSFLHHNVEHLFFEMISLFLYGSNFEEVMRNPKSALKLLAYSSVAPNVVHVLASKLWASASRSPDAQAVFQTVHIGSGGILHCLAQVWRSKVLARLGHQQSVHGITVPTQWSTWLEIFIQKIFNPNLSAMHQVSGMFAGLLYVHYVPLKRRASRAFKKLSPVQQKAVTGALVLFTASTGFMLAKR